MVNKTKKVIMLIAVLSVLVNAMSYVCHAHNGDWWIGQYYYQSSCNQSNMKFMVQPSAITSYFTSSMYRAGTRWNNISSEVNVSVAIWATGMPTTGFYSIYGGVLDDPYTFAYTNCYDPYGYIADFDAHWYYVGISMNTTNSRLVTGSGLTASERTVAAQTTILHEIGHTLKLCHPAISRQLEGHTYSDGYPLALMNTGFPHLYECVSPNIEQHDKDNLIAKWGA